MRLRNSAFIWSIYYFLNSKKTKLKFRLYKKYIKNHLKVILFSIIPSMASSFPVTICFDTIRVSQTNQSYNHQSKTTHHYPTHGLSSMLSSFSASLIMTYITSPDCFSVLSITNQNTNNSVMGKIQRAI